MPTVSIRLCALIRLIASSHVCKLLSCPQCVQAVLPIVCGSRGNDGFSGYYWVVLRTARLDCHFMLMFANYVTGTPSAPTLSIRLLCAAVDEEMWLVVDPTMRSRAQLLGAV